MFPSVPSAAVGWHRSPRILKGSKALTGHLGPVRGQDSSEAIANRAIGPPEGVERPVNTVTFQPPGVGPGGPGILGLIYIYIIRVGGALSGEVAAPGNYRSTARRLA